MGHWEKVKNKTINRKPSIVPPVQVKTLKYNGFINEEDFIKKVSEEIDFENLRKKYGFEGLTYLSEYFKKIANEDFENNINILGKEINPLEIYGRKNK